MLRWQLGCYPIPGVSLSFIIAGNEPLLLLLGVTDHQPHLVEEASMG